MFGTSSVSPAWLNDNGDGGLVHHPLLAPPCGHPGPTDWFPATSPPSQPNRISGSHLAAPASSTRPPNSTAGGTAADVRTLIPDVIHNILTGGNRDSHIHAHFTAGMYQTDLQRLDALYVLLEAEARYIQDLARFEQTFRPVIYWQAGTTSGIWSLCCEIMNANRAIQNLHSQMLFALHLANLTVLPDFGAVFALCSGVMETVYRNCFPLRARLLYLAERYTVWDQRFGVAFQACQNANGPINELLRRPYLHLYQYAEQLRAILEAQAQIDIGHPHFAGLLNLFNLVRTAIDTEDARPKQTEAFEFWQLVTSINGADFSQVAWEPTPHWGLVFVELPNRSLHKGYMFLFKRTIVYAYAEPAPNRDMRMTKFIPFLTIRLRQARVEWLNTSVTSWRRTYYPFKITDGGRTATFMVYTSSAAERRDWIEAFKDVEG